MSQPSLFGDGPIEPPDEGQAVDVVCRHCGGPMVADVALINFGGRRGCERYVMPARCPSIECRTAREEAWIAEAVARGVIDP